MSEPKVPPIGPRIRAERMRREVTIRALARVIGVSPSLYFPDRNRQEPTVSEHVVRHVLSARTPARGAVPRHR